MRILLTILLCNLVLGAAMALYLAVIWRKCKSPIAEHGWNPECADPICGNMWLLCFVPIIGILYKERASCSSYTAAGSYYVWQII